MAWLTGWGRRKSKNIAGSTAGAQANYQMLKIRVHKTTGTDTASGANDTIQHVYVGANVRDDFGDVVFTKADGTTPLDFWMETYVSGDYADFYVEVDTIPISPNTVDIYVYYDKSDETTGSDPQATFPFFDDFESIVGGYNPDTEYALPDVEGLEVLTNWLSWTTGGGGGNAYVEQDSGWKTGGAYSIRQKSAPTSNADKWAHSAQDVDFTNIEILKFDCYIDAGTHGVVGIYIDGVGKWQKVYDTGEFLNQEIDVSAISGIKELRLDGRTAWTTIPMIFKFDTIYGRNYADPEPSWGAFGSEETEVAVAYMRPMKYW